MQGSALKPVIGLFLLTLLAYSILALVAIGLFVLVTPSEASFTFVLVTLGWILAGGLLLTSERRGMADLSEKANLTGGRPGTLRVLPMSAPDESQTHTGPVKGRTGDSSKHVATPLQGRLPPWLTGAAVGFSVVVAGVLMIITGFLLGL